MKKLLIGLLALGSISTFAQDVKSFTVVNKTSGTEQMTFTCLDDSCQELNVLSSTRSRSRNFLISDLITKSNQSREVVLDCSQGDIDLPPFSNTKELVNDFSEGHNRGENLVGAVAVSLIIAPLLLAGDILILPGTGTAYLVGCIDNGNKDFNRKSKLASKELLSKIYNFEDIELKHIQYKELETKIFERIK